MSDEASRVYGNQVADIIASQPRDSTYRPEQPMDLIIKNRRQPTSMAELQPIEIEQLSRLFDDLEQVITEQDEPISLEAAEVYDASGALKYRLYGWDFGGVLLTSATGHEVIAFASQHDLEHWHADQRPVFWAMDRAVNREGNEFQQPSKWCWWKQECWDEIVGKPDDALQSLSYMRARFA